VLYETLEPGHRPLTFNRPDKLNASPRPRWPSARAVPRRDRRGPGVRVVIVLPERARRAFVAGADIAEYRKATAQPPFIAYQLMSRRVFDKLEALPKPDHRAIRGYALGGGFELALCCDVLLCAKSARLGLPEGLLGLSPGGGGTQRLTRAVGKYAASDIMLAAAYHRRARLSARARGWSWWTGDLERRRRRAGAGQAMLKVRRLRRPR
jgi:enoyl-CoA hydratase